LKILDVLKSASIVGYGTLKSEIWGANPENSLFCTMGVTQNMLTVCHDTNVVSSLTLTHKIWVTVCHWDTNVVTV
jgi:hypothetical protein